MAVRTRLITQLASRRPPRRLVGQSRNRNVPIEIFVEADGLLKRWKASRMTQNVARCHCLFSVPGEFRPIFRHRRIEIDKSAVYQHVHACCGYPLANGVDIDDRILRPWLFLGCILEPPQRSTRGRSALQMQSAAPASPMSSKLRLKASSTGANLESASPWMLIVINQSVGVTGLGCGDQFSTSTISRVAVWSAPLTMTNRLPSGRTS